MGMPTGYTCKIKDGISFNDFVMGCARAFGALVTMREDPMDAAIPDTIEPDPYHLKKLKEAEAELKRQNTLTLADFCDMSEAAHREAVKAQERRKQENHDLHNAYLSMLADVGKWEPPTPDHAELKEFMIQQIKESIRFDCYPASDAEPQMAPDDYKAKLLEQTARDIAYHKKEWEAEVDRCEKRTRWIQQLKASLAN